LKQKKSKLPGLAKIVRLMDDLVFFFRSVHTRTGLLEAISNQPVLDAQTSTKIIDKTGAFCQDTAP
jgi:hypothetical protein